MTASRRASSALYWRSRWRDSPRDVAPRTLRRDTDPRLALRSRERPLVFSTERPSPASCAISLWKAAGAVDAQNAPTAPWKPQNGFHSSHKAFLLLLLDSYPLDKWYRATPSAIPPSSPHG